MTPKFLAIKIKSLIDKLSSPIVLKNEDDVSDFLINIYGSKSESELFTENISISNFDLKSFIKYDFNKVHSYSFLDKFDFSIYFKSVEFNAMSAKSSYNGSPVLGYSYSEITKYSEPIIFPKGSVCFFGSKEGLIESLLTNLISQGANVISFSKKRNNNFKKIDLLNSLLISNNLEEILNLINGANNHFLFVWSLVVKDLIKDEKNFKYDEFLDSFNLDFIIKYYIDAVNNQNYISKIILSYLKTIPDFNIESQIIKISDLSKEFHYEQSKFLYTFFHKIISDYKKSNDLYDNLILKDFSDIAGETIFIGDFSEESYFLLNNIFRKINKAENEFIFFTDSIEINPFYSKNSSFLLVTSYLEKPNSNSFDHFAFGETERYIQPDSDIILKIISLTPDISTNIFDLTGKNIALLAKDEFYFWTPKHKKNYIHSEYSFKKIKLND